MNYDTNNNRPDFFKDILIFALAPIIVTLLILISATFCYFNIGPKFLYIIFALTATLLGGYSRFISGFKDIFRAKITVNVFVTIAMIATIAIGNFLTSSMLILIMTIASALESYTLDKTRKSIRSLLDLAPKNVSVKRNGEEVSISIEEVHVGDIVVVRPGERIAVDGVVLNGASSVNQAPITGESIPVEKFKGSLVYSGTLNEQGRIEIETSKVGEDTTLAKIINLTENAQSTKAPFQNIADKFTQWFLPFVAVIAIISFLISHDIRVAVSVLLVACPCAFAIATPTAVTAGIANMAKRSILVKGGIFIEQAGKIDTLLVDKTGTFTLGSPKVVEVISTNDFTENDVIYFAGIGEKYSEHPLSRAILKYIKEQKVDIPDPEDFKVEIGKGVIARWNNQDIIIGKEELFLDKGIQIEEDMKSKISIQKEKGRSIMLIAIDLKPVGLIALSDEIRQGTQEAISIIKRLGIKNVVMLTGDNSSIAKAVADEIGVDSFEANLLPEDKQKYVATLQKQGQKVAMIGDGINDAPALAMADIGIAMGASGTDVAIETADITLMKDNIFDVVDFISTSKKVFKRIKLNIFFSIIYNLIGLILASFGLLTPIIAILFQEAGCITVVLSSTLLLWNKSNNYNELNVIHYKEKELVNFK